MKRVFLSLIAIFLCIFYFYSRTDAATQNDVLINEIAWMGNTNSANNEWMELFNNTNNSIDLFGWMLKSIDEKIKINLAGQIAAGGFYLLERTDDNSVAGIIADLIYKGALTNSGMDLKLYDNLGNLIDQANYLSGWPAGDNKTKQTMERIESLAWQTSKESNGTPKSKNSKSEIPNPKQIQNPNEQKAEVLNPTPNAQNLTSKITYPEGVFINEILPAPEGADETNEWIELYNNNSFDVDLSDWKIEDIEGTITTHIFLKNTKILGNGYSILKRPETKITLNNDQDGLNLMWPNGKIVNSILYEKALKNQSYNKIDSGWQWSIILTPGTKNIITAYVSKKETKVLPKSKKSDNKISVSTAAISQPINPLKENPNNKEKENKSNPLFLFLITLGIIITLAIIILILKLKPKGFRKSNT